MNEFNAALLIIGNEILSGRTEEKNLSVLAKLLNGRGWCLAEVRVVADDAAAIADALNALRQRYTLVVTSGGIGPTHDDITTESVAAAFGLEVVENPQAVEILTAFYTQRDMPFTLARRRMTRTPLGAQVLKSDFPGAPAYRIENVVVCAGVPAIFNLMAGAAAAQLPLGVVRQAQALLVYGGESIFADALATLAQQYPAVEIGSYPREQDGKYFCQIVFTAADADARDAAQKTFCTVLTEMELEFEELT